MKIAVLISGDYRTFNVCRKTMTFLDDPRVDIYVSTWDTSEVKNPKLDYVYNRKISADDVSNDLRKPGTVLIQPINSFTEKKYNERMIHRWKKGYELIKNSKIPYDYILCIRPDLFFTKQFPDPFLEIEKYKDNIGFTWAHSLHLKKLSDTCFMSSTKTMDCIFEKLNIKDWQDSKENDWHIWWFNFIESTGITPVDLTELNYSTFARPWINDTDDFEMASIKTKDWRDLFAMHQIDLYGEEFVIEKIWNAEVVGTAKEKWNSGYFEKYK